MLLMLMFLVALMGVLLAVTGGLWHTAAMRDKEAQLLFVGGEYQRALARYKAATPSGMPAEPERLEQLLLDKRQQVPVRHLRQLYRDPLTDSIEWGLVKDGGRIAGVFSQGAGTPLKQDNFPWWAKGFAKARSYAAWQFLAGTTSLPVESKGGTGTIASGVASSPAPSGAGPATAPSNAETATAPNNAETAAACNDAFRATVEQCKAIVYFVDRIGCRNMALKNYWSCQGR
jgi:hypothetical protein